VTGRILCLWSTLSRPDYAFFCISHPIISLTAPHISAVWKVDLHYSCRIRSVVLDTFYNLITIHICDSLYWGKESNDSILNFNMHHYNGWPDGFVLNFKSTLKTTATGVRMWLKVRRYLYRCTFESTAKGVRIWLKVRSFPVGVYSEIIIIHCHATTMRIKGAGIRWEGSPFTPFRESAGLILTLSPRFTSWILNLPSNSFAIKWFIS